MFRGAVPIISDTVVELCDVVRVASSGTSKVWLFLLSFGGHLLYCSPFFRPCAMVAHLLGGKGVYSSTLLVSDVHLFTGARVLPNRLGHLVIPVWYKLQVSKAIISTAPANEDIIIEGKERKEGTSKVTP